MVDMTQFFQINEPVRSESISVDDTSKNIAKRRPQQNKRRFYTIRNNGATNITIPFGSIAVANQGQLLKAGETFTDSSDNFYECYQDDLNAIGDVVGGSIIIVER